MGRAGRGRARGARAPLTLAALAIVLASAALHAAWNAVVADAEDTHATTAVALLVGAAVLALTWRLERRRGRTSAPWRSRTAVLVVAGVAALAFSG